MRRQFSSPNEDIYQEKGDIPLWVIGNYFGVHENTVRNWLKQSLSEEKKQEILDVIKKAKSEVSRMK